MKTITVVACFLLSCNAKENRPARGAEQNYGGAESNDYGSYNVAEHGGEGSGTNGGDAENSWTPINSGGSTNIGSQYFGGSGGFSNYAAYMPFGAHLYGQQGQQHPTFMYFGLASQGSHMLGSSHGGGENNYGGNSQSHDFNDYEARSENENSGYGSEHQNFGTSGTSNYGSDSSGTYSNYGSSGSDFGTGGTSGSHNYGSGVDFGTGGSNYGSSFSGYGSNHHAPQVYETTKTFPVHKTIRVPVPHAIPHPVAIPVPIKIPHPYAVRIPVPVTVEKTVQVPVEKIVHYQVEKPVPVKIIKKVPYPVPKPYPVPVPVYKIKYIYHTKHKHINHDD